jgi:NAD(P)-dependent dehydrogenase (short-subunit alcohol dehydrogenase family)
MSYFLTGATGFIGKYLVRHLMARKGTIYVLVRPQSLHKAEALRQWAGDTSGRIVAVSGDLTEPGLGVSVDDRESLTDRIDHFFHLAAIYDLEATGEDMDVANIVGTDHALGFAAEIKAGCFHHVSSIASAGLYRGIFTEDMFEEAQGLEHPYFRTKHESEALVRKRAKVPWRVYRPGMVVGHSQTGQIDKVDGPYYFFKAIQKIRENIPSWFPLIGLEGGYANLVPVDFVAAALDHLAHVPDQDGQCFHLTDPRPRRMGEVINLFAKVGHAPTMTVRLDPKLFRGVPEAVGKAIARVEPVQQVTDQILGDLGIPHSVMQLINYPTRFDSRKAEALLEPAGIRVPDLEDYAWRLWDYWERHLDPDLFVDRTLSGAVRGKVVIITGGSSGIGRATALKLAAAGAKVVIGARDPEKLDETRAEIEKAGGKAFTYPVDLTNMEACDAFAQQVLEDHGHVDVLINNAGRSIRRAIELSYDRFHDYERTIQLNYYAAVRLTLALLPSMVERKRGHIINISSIGVLSNAPRFSAYVASKAALESFSRCAAAEYRDKGISFTIINMPLVRTPMIAPTKIYDEMPTIITPEEAAGMVAEAVIYKPQRIATKLGIFAEILHLIAPKLTEVVMNQAYKMFPDSSAAKGGDGEAGAPKPPSQEAMIFASIMRGIHW